MQQATGFWALFENDLIDVTVASMMQDDDENSEQ
jgi:hypothetical protein